MTVMKVLCDVSLLGWSRKDDGSTAPLTGMPRAIVELSARLVRSAAVPEGSCAVTFCAGKWAARAGAFLQEHPAFAGARLLPTAGDAEGITPEAFAEADVFHTTHNAVPAGARACPRLAVVQTVYDMIPFLMPELFTPADLAFYADVLARLRGTDHVITISESARGDFLAHTGHDPARVHVVPLAADRAQFRPCGDDGAALDRVRVRYGIPPGPYFLSVSTFEPRKNLPHVIRAFAGLVQTTGAGPGDDLRLVLAGGTGWKFDAIFDALGGMDTRVRERIVVTGHVAEEDLAPLFSGAWAFFYLPLLEGFGLPPLEAMQCGTPVVTSNTSSLPEVVGDAGLLLDPHDGAALRQAMCDLLERPGLRQELRQRGLARAERFSWERCARETVAVYRLAAADKTTNDQ